MTNGPPGTAVILDGKALAARVRAEVKREVDVLARDNVTPGLAVVLVGDDPASALYVRNKQKACTEAGIRTYDHKLGAATSQSALLDLIERLNGFDDVDGILVQLPLPPQLDPTTILQAVAAHKDIDGFHPENVGLLHSGTPRFVPCTPAGIMQLLDESGIALESKHAVVIGRSNIVGKPIAALLTRANATVTLCHSKTRDLAGLVKQADVVVAAAGKPHLVQGSWIRDGAVVIDVGIHRFNNKLVGDVVFDDALAHARAITPVPGGVGPMTIAMLCVNSVRAARMRRLPST